MYLVTSDQLNAFFFLQTGMQMPNQLDSQKELFNTFLLLNLKYIQLNW